jgi:hypothetical protein
MIMLKMALARRLGASIDDIHKSKKVFDTKENLQIKRVMRKRNSFCIKPDTSELLGMPSTN